MIFAKPGRHGYCLCEQCLRTGATTAPDPVEEQPVTDDDYAVWLDEFNARRELGGQEERENAL